MNDSALYEELLDSIDEVLELTPCGDYDTFCEVVEEQLGTELVDVYGHDGTAIGEGLREIWNHINISMEN